MLLKTATYGPNCRTRANVLDEWRTPRAYSDGIEQQQLLVFASVHKVGTQRRRATKIVGNHVRPIKVPVPQERSQETILNAERYILAISLFCDCP